MDPPQAGLVAFNVMFVLLSLCPYLITTDFLQQIILRAAHLCNVVALQFMTVLFFDINLLALLQRVRVYDILTRLLKHPAFFPPYLRLQGVRLRRHFTVSCDITFCLILWSRSLALWVPRVPRSPCLAPAHNPRHVPGSRLV